MLVSTIILEIIFLIAVVLSLKRLKYYAKNYFLMNKLPGPAPGGLLIGNLSYLQTTPGN